MMEQQVYSNKDKVHQYEFVKEVALKSSLSIAKTRKILDYYNNYWGSIINFGYSLNFMKMFAMVLKPSKTAAGKDIIITPSDRTFDMNNPYISQDLVHSLKINDYQVLQVIRNYNQSFKRALINDNEKIVNYLSLFYVSKNDKYLKITASRYLKKNKPEELIYLTSDGLSETFKTFKKQDLQYNTVWFE